MNRDFNTVKRLFGKHVRIRIEFDVQEYSPPWGVHGWDTGDGSELADHWFDTLEEARSYLRDHLRRSEREERYVLFRLCHFSEVVEEYQTEIEWVPRFLSVRTK